VDQASAETASAEKAPAEKLHVQNPSADMASAAEGISAKTPAARVLLTGAFGALGRVLATSRKAKSNPPPPLEGLGREADQGWGEGEDFAYPAHRVPCGSSPGHAG
jgi:hypothetical protein